MALTQNTGSGIPITGSETTLASITGGPFDHISVYFQGGTGAAGGPLQLALYATVNGIQTRIAQSNVMGSPVASLIEWTYNLPTGIGETELVSAGGTAYAVTIIDLNVP